MTFGRKITKRFKICKVFRHFFDDLREKLYICSQYGHIIYHSNPRGQHGGHDIPGHQNTQGS